MKMWFTNNVEEVTESKPVQVIGSVLVGSIILLFIGLCIYLTSITFQFWNINN
jgi:hypothetical protein